MSMRVLRHLSVVAVVMSIALLGSGLAGRPLPAAAEEPVVIEMGASHERINPGECALVEWAVRLDGEWPVIFEHELVEPHGHREVCPHETTNFMLSVETPEGVVSRQVTILVGDGPDDEGRFRGEEPWHGGEEFPVHFQVVDPEAIPRGACATLVWEVGDMAESVVIVNGEEAPRVGNIRICPEETTRYELIVEGPESPGIREIILHVMDVHGEGEHWEGMRPPEMEGEPPERTGEVELFLHADPDAVPRGACAALNWEVAAPAEYPVMLNGQMVDSVGSQQICPEDTTTYELLVETPGGPVVRHLTFHVGEGPGQEPLPPEPPSPPPQGSAPATGGADVRPSDLFPQGGTVWTRITNDGHDTLTNNRVEITLSGCGAGKQFGLTIAPGQTQMIDTGCQLAAGSNSYTVSARAIDFTDPNPGNNSFTETLAAGAAPPAPPPPPKPPGKPSGADVHPSDLYIQSGALIMRITNDGHDTLTNKKVKVTISGCGPAKEHTISLAPGETQAMDTYCQPAAGKKTYTITTSAVDFTDPNSGNNSYTETIDPGGGSPPIPPGGGSAGILTADLAVTDLFPSSLPTGPLWVRITNGGPDKVQQVISLVCTQITHTYKLGDPTTSHGSSETMNIDLDPGQTKEYKTSLYVHDTTKNWYEYKCRVHHNFKDPKPGNEEYSETIPPPP